MQRVVRPELLDSLPYDHPDALRNRRGLRILNSLMGNYRWMERQLRSCFGDCGSVLEIGSGGGDLGRRLWRRGVARRLDGLDLCPKPEDWPSEWDWWREDLKSFHRFDGYDAVLANLILHQFEDRELAVIGERMRRSARFIFASEPARRRGHLAQLRLLSFFGFGRVTRHDGAVSIRAGFVGDELPRLLGLPEDSWSWDCRMGWRGQYFMAARRRSTY